MPSLKGKGSSRNASGSPHAPGEGAAAQASPKLRKSDGRVLQAAFLFVEIKRYFCTSTLAHDRPWGLSVVSTVQLDRMLHQPGSGTKRPNLSALHDIRRLL